MAMLTEKQRKFVEHYRGNASEAARKAGLHQDYGRQLLTKKHIQDAIKAQVAINLDQNIFTRDDIIRVLSSIATDTSIGVKHRLRATELIARAQGIFSRNGKREKTRHTTLEEKRRIAREILDELKERS